MERREYGYRIERLLAKCYGAILAVEGRHEIYIFCSHYFYFAKKLFFFISKKKNIFSKPFSEAKKLLSGPLNENILAAFCTAISYRVCQSQIPA
jgi:hypothetical protein